MDYGVNDVTSHRDCCRPSRSAVDNDRGRGRRNKMLPISWVVVSACGCRSDLESFTAAWRLEHRNSAGTLLKQQEWDEKKWKLFILLCNAYGIIIKTLVNNQLFETGWSSDYYARNQKWNSCILNRIFIMEHKLKYLLFIIWVKEYFHQYWKIDTKHNLFRR